MSHPEDGLPPDLQRWLSLAPKPRVRTGTNLKWDVFVSYRSVNRKWALALYDTLTEAGFDVFLDQFVLPAGARLDKFLEENLQASASGVVLWSGDAATSEYVDKELATMQEIRKKRSSFKVVLAKLDAKEPPFSTKNELWVDFTSYPDGPRGGELLRLMFGLVGEPLSDEAVREVEKLDRMTSDLILQIATARTEGDVGRLRAMAEEQPPALTGSPLPLGVLADALIAVKQPEAALKVLDEARALFPASVRLQQLGGLALRRQGRFVEALNLMGSLYQQKHRDPETVGIYAATWYQRYKAERRRIYLERSYSLYAEAFRLAPDSYYVGINAASKSLFLGEETRARSLADSVLPLVSDHVDGDDYWATATHAEAQLILGNLERAAELYRAAVVRHSEESGSIGSTRDQATDLLAASKAEPAQAAVVLAAFSLD